MGVVTSEHDADNQSQVAEVPQISGELQSLDTAAISERVKMLADLTESAECYPGDGAFFAAVALTNNVTERQE